MVVSPWVPSITVCQFPNSAHTSANGLIVQRLSVKAFVTCHLFPAGTLTDTVTLEKLNNICKWVFTQEFVQFPWWHGLEGLVRGSKDRVDPVAAERLRQPRRLDGGYQHAADTHMGDVTHTWKMSPACEGCHLPTHTSPLRAGGAQPAGITPQPHLCTKRNNSHLSFLHKC